MPSKRKLTATTAATAITPDPDAPSTSTGPGADDSPAASSAAPNNKRQRVSRACDQCRAAREKCDGIQPLCFPCVSQNRPCTYAANPKKRGVQTGYIKTLEVALAWLFEKVPGCEEALENLLLHEGGQGQNLLVGKDSDRANRLHKRWRKSKVHREIDRILSGGDSTQSRTDKSSPFDDEGSDTGRSDKTPRTFPNSTPGQQGNSSANGLSSKSAGSLYRATTAPTNIKLPSNHWELVDIYFSYTHCWYPILEKQDLLKTVYHYPEAGLDIQQLGPHPAAHAELWAAMALAAYQDAASTTSDAAVSETPSLCPDEIYNIARRLVPTEEGNFEIQHARALLLLALINVGKGKKTCAWILVGLAHRIALDVSELHSNDERSSRRATAVLMGCYILDTLISVHRRGMPSLETAGIIEGMSIPEDNLDEWQPWAPCKGFGSTSRLSSRSPAYSLTTFNQVYDVFKFMRKRTLQRQNGLLPTEHPSEAMMLLHQTIKPGLPFARFIVARDSSSITIPSAYVLRILFLWVGAILDSTDESPCTLILESIEQYLAQFGACGAPPFFSSCLAMMRQHRSFDDLHPHGKERWQTVQDTLMSTWSASKPKSPETVRPASATSKATGISDTPAASTTTHTATSLTTTTPSDIFPSTNVLQTPTLLPTQYPSQTNAPFMMNTFSPSKQPQSNHPPQSLNAAAAGANVGMNMFDHSNMIHSIPGQTALGRPPGMGHHRESFGAASLDYDALLDDLSSMDYVDRVDADPQFMANLGFAPGCDISEILSREFGAI
ncbi:hypothetical protein N0V93_001733 [Gnomoniopsis smithogilvyi]|uniref:Zn(2)-C6 fungal-type domain-containing protein n=1 Tax=Gnomoniopsis smithogilvyi TaxID=1191159 RepID=A0A9W9D1Y5_9PEZI|nr:hypothetical protein N0V93_001733 [Gnomoniopsis smithogilvyi]